MVSIAKMVLETEVEGVHANGFGNFVHVGFEREDRLWISEAAQFPAYWSVRINGISGVAQRIRAICIHHAFTGNGADRRPTGSVSAGGLHRAAIDSSDTAIFLYSYAHFKLKWI